VTSKERIMGDGIQKRAGLPKTLSGKAALDNLRAAANHQKTYANMTQEDLVLCLDVSSSMLESMDISNPKDQKLRQMINATHDLVRASSAPICKLGLVTYGDDAKVLCSLTDKYNIFDASVDTIKADGWTNIGLGLMKSVEMLGQSTKMRLKRIILLTDGMEACTKPPLASEVVDRYVIPMKIVIDCVAFGEDADLDLLNSIAKKTGGTVYSASNADALKKTFLKLESGARWLLTANNP